MCDVNNNFITILNIAGSISLPSAKIYPPNSFISISSQSIKLSCTGVGVLRWYRGYNFDTPLDKLTQLLDEGILSLRINLTEDGYSQGSDERNRTYFCTATNIFGVARSRAVQTACEIVKLFTICIITCIITLKIILSHSRI